MPCTDYWGDRWKFRTVLSRRRTSPRETAYAARPADCRWRLSAAPWVSLDEPKTVFVDGPKNPPGKRARPPFARHPAIGQIILPSSPPPGSDTPPPPKCFVFH